MDVNSYKINNLSFNGFFNNKYLLKGLEFSANKSQLFTAGASLGFSILRPISIYSAPNTDKENRKLACAKSISSSLTGFILMLALTPALSRSFTAIEKNPQKYIKQETIKNLKDGCPKLIDSRSYMLASQMFKLGLGLAASIPKAVLTASGIPWITKTFFEKNDNRNTSKELAFRGKPSERIADGIGKILNKKGFQEFVNKHKNSNFPMHLIAGTDILTTAVFIHQAKNSKKIKEERKNTLIYNSVISTGLSIACSYIIDRLLNKPTRRLIEKFKQANKNSPKLSKYVEGIQIAKPVLIMGTVYYIAIPLVSTILAEQTEKKKRKGGN